MLEETEKNKIEQEEIESDQNLLGVFSILFEVAKRTNPEKYLIGYKNNND